MLFLKTDVSDNDVKTVNTNGKKNRGPMRNVELTTRL